MNGLSAVAEITDMPPLSWRILVFIVLVCIDIGFNAAAGAAAASTGAYANSKSNSATAKNTYDLSRVLQLGALAGTMKSGILAMMNFGKEFGGVNLGMWLILILLGNTFGICVIITSAISKLALGEVPGALLIAAVVTAIPLGGEMIGIELVPDTPSLTLSLVGFDALSGYVFARMSHNEGYDICDYNAAATAGAVYGTLICARAFIVWLIKGPTTTTESSNGSGTVRTITNRLGSYTIYDPMRQIDTMGLHDWP